MSTFLDAIHNWQPFFSAVASSTATLTGLLFVSLSLNLQKLRDSESTRWFKTARGAFGDFLYVLMVSLMFLVPLKAAFGFTIALVVLGAARGIGVIRSMVVAFKNKSEKVSFMKTIREFALPVIAAVGLIIIAFSILFGTLESIAGLVIVIAALLVSACWKSWFLLVGEHLG